MDQTFSNPGGRQASRAGTGSPCPSGRSELVRRGDQRRARRGRGHRAEGSGAAVPDRRADRRTSRRCSSGSTGTATAPASSPCPPAAPGASCCATWRCSARHQASSRTFTRCARASRCRSASSPSPWISARPARVADRDARRRGDRGRRAAGEHAAERLRAPRGLPARGLRQGEAVAAAGVALRRGRGPRRLRDGQVRARRGLGRARGSCPPTIVVVDTSASADESARQQKAAAAEAILRAMSPSDHFALIALDSAPAVLHPKEGWPRRPTRRSPPRSRGSPSTRRGATDLGALFESALGRVHGKEQPAVIYIGDGLATSGEVTGAPRGAAPALAHGSRARFFTVGVGANANHALLRELARAGADSGSGSTRPRARRPRCCASRARSRRRPSPISRSTSAPGSTSRCSPRAARCRAARWCCSRARTTRCPTKAIVKGRLAGRSTPASTPSGSTGASGRRSCRAFWAAEKMPAAARGRRRPRAQRGQRWWSSGSARAHHAVPQHARARASRRT